MYPNRLGTHLYLLQTIGDSMRKFELSEATINSIMNYLGSQPYAQVKPLFDAVTEELQGSTVKPVPVPDKVNNEKKEA